MASEAIRLSAVVPASAQRIYDAWLDERTHAAITNSSVTIDAAIGGKFMAADGFIGGQTLWLDPGRLIVQSWRAADFPEEAEDSRVEIHLEEVPEGTRVVIDHRDIPLGHAERYEEGWQTWYLEPMCFWFEEHPEPAFADDSEIAGADAPPPAELVQTRQARKRAGARASGRAPKAEAPRKAGPKKATRSAAPRKAASAGARAAPARKPRAAAGKKSTAPARKTSRSGATAGKTASTPKERRAAGPAAQGKRRTAKGPVAAKPAASRRPPRKPRA